MSRRRSALTAEVKLAANFVQIESREQLDRLFEESFERPVVIFKHSNSCGISSHVREIVSDVEGTINVVVVQTHRELSNEIASRTAYRHQSPQAFVIRDGEVVYHATHYGINPEKIAEATAN